MNNFRFVGALSVTLLASWQFLGLSSNAYGTNDTTSLKSSSVEQLSRDPENTQPTTQSGIQENTGDSIATSVNYTLLSKKGGRLDWSHRTGQIAFDSSQLAEAVENGKHLVYTMDSDGDNIRCVSCGLFPKGTSVGQPAWGPEGRWLVAQVVPAKCRLLNILKNPGAGFGAQLWAFNAETGVKKVLQETPCAMDSGILHAHFSKDGSKLTWSKVHRSINPFNRYLTFGAWKLMLADVEWNEDGPTLSNVTALQPGKDAFYENHGLDDSNEHLLYTATNQIEPGYQQTTISQLNIKTDEVQVLASGGFNEHAHFTGDGSSVIYMADTERTVLKSIFGFRHNDYWVSRTDGTNTQRITTFNVPGRFPDSSLEGHPKDDTTYAVADFSTGPERDSIMALVFVNSGTAGPVGDSGEQVENWIVKISTPIFSDGLK